MQAINQALKANGWVGHSINDTDIGRTMEYIQKGGTQLLSITYRMYGSTGSMRLCRAHGKDPNDGINWGVERATLHWLVEDLTKAEGDVWQRVKSFTGKNKKGQLIKFAKEGLSAGANV
jgi:hypothetical protein